LGSLAKVVRSKNAGPFLLTFDIMFEDEIAQERVRASGCLTAEVIGRLYHVHPNRVMFFDYPAARAFKATIPREVSCGDPRDADVYGAQQHMLLSELTVP
jgi:hypothetical protein